MRRRSTTLLIAMFALGGSYFGAMWWVSRDPAPPVMPMPVEEQASGPLAAEPPGNRPLLAYGPRVWVEIEQVGSYLPSTAANIRVHRGSAEVTAKISVVGGAGMSWPEADRRDGEALVRIEEGARTMFRRIMIAGADGSGELQIGITALLRGSVVDQLNKPVAGARVWCGGELDNEILTDEKGCFAAEVASGDGVPVVVRAVGKAWSYQLVSVPPAGSEVGFVLAADCELHVQLVGSELTLPSAFVRISAVGASFTTELLQYPFFAQQLFAGQANKDGPAVDGQGHAVIRGLPRGSTIGVSAGGPCLPVTAPQQVELLRASTEVALSVAHGAACRGSVVDEHGDPLAGAFVWCWPQDKVPKRSSADRWLQPREVDAVAVSCVVTGADGAFDLLVEDAELCVLTIEHRDFARLVRPLARDVRIGLRCPLPGGAATPPRMHVPPPIAGKAWPLRVDPGDQIFRVVAADRDFVHPLPVPMLALIRARVATSTGEWSPPRVAKDVMLSGVVSLPLALTLR